MDKTLFIIGFIGALSVGIDDYPLIGLAFCVVGLIGLHWPFGNKTDTK